MKSTKIELNKRRLIRMVLLAAFDDVRYWLDKYDKANTLFNKESALERINYAKTVAVIEYVFQLKETLNLPDNLIYTEIKILFSSPKRCLTNDVDLSSEESLFNSILKIRPPFLDSSTEDISQLLDANDASGGIPLFPSTS